MPWGKHAGKPLRSIPKDYWAWLLNQGWFREHHDLYQYADQATTPKMTFEEAVRSLGK